MQKKMNAVKHRQIVDKVALARKEKWLSTQVGLDSTAMAISGDGQGLSAPRHVKIIGSALRPLCGYNLFRSIKGKDTVHSLSLVGVQIDEDAAVQLFETLQDPRTRLRVLQLWSLNMSCVPVLCHAIQRNCELQEIRLTFRRDLNREQTSGLITALRINQSIHQIKLFGVDLSRHAREIEALVRDRSCTKELRLTRCQISNASFLACAVASSKVLEVLDLSMNEISSEVDVAMMLQSTSLRTLCLSGNHVGRSNGSPLSKALIENRCLEEFMLEANPLSVDFATSLRDALQVNTTLKRLGFLQAHKGSVVPPLLDTEIRYLVALNEAGRNILRAASSQNEPDPLLAVIPHVFRRIHGEPSSIYGLLREHPRILCKSSI